jgi:hypothetical protein
MLSLTHSFQIQIIHNTYHIFFLFWIKGGLRSIDQHYRPHSRWFGLPAAFA